MVAKAFFVLCASALLVQTISGQCIGYGNGLGLANNIGNGLGLANNIGRAELAGSRLVGAELSAARLGGAGLVSAPIAAANGGGLTVTSTSPIAPTGVTVVSENAIDGAVEVGGQLPVLSAVALEGAIPTGGAAGTTYSCGNGNVGIASESLAAAGMGNGLARAELAGARLAGAGLAGTGLAGTGPAGAGLAGARLAGAEIGAANRLGRPCGAIY